jgi:mono/diheme cytochrome c family protein
MRHKRYLTLGVVLIGAAFIAVASWGYARPAAASAEHSDSERRSQDVRATEHTGSEDAGSGYELRGMEAGQDSLDIEGQDDESEVEDQGEDVEIEDGEDESDEGGDLTTATTGPTTPTTAEPTTTTTTAGAGATPPTTAQPTTTTTAASVDAAALYAQYCASTSCHPNGTPSGLPTSQVASAIAGGVPGMPGFSGVLMPNQITALATYVSAGGH